MILSALLFLGAFSIPVSTPCKAANGTGVIIDNTTIPDRGVIGSSGPTVIVQSSTSAVVGDYVCNGTNDQVQIQQAINFVNASGGGIVQLSDGTFNINGQIDLAQNLVLLGKLRLMQVWVLIRRQLDSLIIHQTMNWDFRLRVRCVGEIYAILQ